MIDFPASPTVGQQFTAAGVTWTWDGAKWQASGLGTSYLPIAGGTLTGPLTLAGNPTAALQPTTKQYVDALPVAMNDNKIINGDMRIDQRNAGASGATNGYTVDRWQYQSSQAVGTWVRGSNPASQFPYYLNFATSSPHVSAAGDYFEFIQIVEADMVSDFAWGIPQAQPATLSFWALASISGTYGGSIVNANVARSFVFSFSLTAGVWSKITVPIPADTGGTWTMSGNGAAFSVRFDLGSGSTYRGTAGAWTNGTFIGVTGGVSIVATNAAAFAVTGVKLEIGSVATPFNRQSLAKSMADCQRYYQKIGGSSAADVIFQTYAGGAASAGNFGSNIGIPAMRAVPTATRIGTWNTANITSYSLYPSISNLGVQITPTAVGSVYMFTADATTYLTLNAEL
jgi:hypothetical protein